LLHPFPPRLLPVHDPAAATTAAAAATGATRHVMVGTDSAPQPGRPCLVHTMQFCSVSGTVTCMHQCGKAATASTCSTGSLQPRAAMQHSKRSAHAQLLLDAAHPPLLFCCCPQSPPES
jgi:hypothetical protein